MRYRLRTLLILLALGPPLGAWGYRATEAHLRHRREEEALRQLRSQGRWPIGIAFVGARADHPNTPRKD